jgi:chondroitin AC lyase
LAAGDLLPLTEPVKPIEGRHDMGNMPDMNQVGQAIPPDQPQPNVDLPVADYDFGLIPAGPEDVSQVFYVQNTGTEPLEIRSVVTSCGCTTATLSSSVIPPGQRADLTVVFNPDFHDTEGPVTRAVWLETNDPDQPVAEVKFAANVRKE